MQNQLVAHIHISEGDGWRITINDASYGPDEMWEKQLLTSQSITKIEIDMEKRNLQRLKQRKLMTITASDD